MDFQKLVSVNTVSPKEGCISELIAQSQHPFLGTTNESRIRHWDYGDVSEVGSKLKADGVIDYSRGEITILDRARLLELLQGSTK